MNKNLLSNYCELIVDCEHKTAPIQDEGYPSIRTPNIGRGRLILDNVNRVSEEVYRMWSRRAEPQAGDLIFAREAPVGNVAVVPSNLKVCLGQRTVLIRADKTKIETAYLLYLLLGDEIQSRFYGQTNGATVAHLNLADIRNLEMPILPNRNVQKNIGTILSTYDDLIENNSRRIKILEEIAQMIYHEWFVRYRFPGYEQTKFVESSLGKIPEEWCVVAVKEVAKLFKGRSYRSTELTENKEIPFITLKCIDRDGGFRRDGIKGYKGVIKLTQTVSSGDIVIALTDMTQERRIIAHVARIPDIGVSPYVFSMDLVKIVPNYSNIKEFLYGLFRYSSFPNQVKLFANGVNVLHLNPSHIETYLFCHPSDEVIQKYNKLVSPLYYQIDSLHKKNHLLAITRDLLLPKLISGRIDVSNLDFQM